MSKSLTRARTRPQPTKRPKQTYDPQSDIIRPRHIQAATGLHSATIWRLRKRGAFPEPIRLSDQAVGWRRADVTAWLAAREGAR
jgi:prophage regulatory protein